MRTAFIETLCEVAKQNERIWLLTGDLGYSILERFANRFPVRYVNMGVAEQNMTGVAAGLALSGKIVFTYSIANFPTIRCLEQIRNDICYHNLNVKIVAVGGGLDYGTAGYTHHAVEDLAVLRAMPNLTILAPGDPIETRLATKAIVDWSGPCYIRLGKTIGPPVHVTEPEFKIGKGIVIREGMDLVLISVGGALRKAVSIADLLDQKGLSTRVLSLHTLKPIDHQALKSLIENMPVMVTIEEHNVIGGLGTCITEVLINSGLETKTLYCFGVDRVSATPVNNRYAFSAPTLDPEDIATKLINIVSEGS